MNNTLRNFIVAASALVATFSCSPKSEMDKFIDDLMSKMTVEQKIGQLNLHSSSGFVSGLTTTTEDQNVALLKQGLLGGLYGTTNTEYLREIQKVAIETGSGIPLIFGQDVIHGQETIMPIPLAMSTSWNPALIERTARAAAKEATALGINWVFSPMLDIARDARWGRIAEGNGEDPYLGGEIAKAMVYGYQGHDADIAADEVLACVKHYAMYGAAEAGRDYNTVQLTRQEALNGYMRPYQQAAFAGAASYMSSFNEFEGIPATMNTYLLDELLRGDYGFKGFVVTDATAIKEEVNHGIGDLQTVSALSLKAGIDMDMNSDGFLGTLQKSLDEGKVSMKDIDRACRRILEAKYRLGLFEDPFRYLDASRQSEIYTEETKKLAREAANESIVLLKNDGILPLKPSQKVAVVGPLADDHSAMAGSWCMSKHKDETVTILEGVKEHASSVSFAQGSYLFLDEALEQNARFGINRTFRENGLPKVHTVPNSVLVAEAVAKARQADVVIACVGEIANMNGEGASRSDITIPDAERELLKALAATGKPVVMVLTTGRPLALEWESENMNAILNSWAAGTEAGHSIADILYGDVNPSAKLTTSFPYNVGQEPIYYNHKNTGRPHPDYDPYKKYTSCYMDVVNGPLYSFGYGLSYTTYEYGPMKLSSDSMSMDGSVTASVEIKNSGAYDGKEIVQLYIHDIYATMARPVKELRGFQKVDIKAGETVKVEFKLTAEDLKYYNHELEYVCEPGDFEIMIGSSCYDLQTAILTVE